MNIGVLALAIAGVLGVVELILLPYQKEPVRRLERGYYKAICECQPREI